MTHAELEMRDDGIRLERNAGASIAELSARHGLSAASIGRIVKSGPRQPKPVSEPHLQAASMFRQGLTLAKIGQQFGVTRERIRQILAKQGIRAVEGGCSIRTQEKRARKSDDAEARSQLKYGLSKAQVAEYRKQGLVFAYRNQCRSASSRGIEFSLSFKQWILIWEASGKLDLRGRGIGKYVMSRIRDDGGYEIGNVHIQLATQNSREAVQKWRGKTKVNRGVFHSYPGLERGYRADANGKTIGYFASEQEAVAARAAALGA